MAMSSLIAVSHDKANARQATDSSSVVIEGALNCGFRFNDDTDWGCCSDCTLKVLECGSGMSLPVWSCRDREVAESKSSGFPIPVTCECR